jgi:hypothetical protein
MIASKRLDVDEQVYSELKAIAQLRGITMGKYVNLILKAELTRQKERGKTDAKV